MTSEEILYKIIGYLDDTENDYKVCDSQGREVKNIILEDGIIYFISNDCNQCDCGCVARK